MIVFKMGVPSGKQEKIKEANPGKLCIEIDQLNSSRNYYKGKIGERDIRRMIHEAGYVK
jgi:hypothetical protein